MWTQRGAAVECIFRNILPGNCPGIHFDNILTTFETPQGLLLIIFRGPSEMVDFGHFDMFSIIFRGPFGVHQNRHLSLSLRSRPHETWRHKVTSDP